jgi:hypothetical protein
VLAGAAALVAQSAFVADYPERKFVMFLLFALPIVTSAVLHWRAFQAWALADHRRTVAATLAIGGALAVAAIATPLGRPLPNGALLARIVLASGVLGLAALAVLLVTNRRRLTGVALVALGVSMLAPLAYADLSFVYRRPTFTYRDAQIAAGREVNGQVTAGSWSLGMQLYNTSRPVLNRFPSRIPLETYREQLVRYEREYGAAALFDYVNPTSRTNLERLGFRLVETYAIKLPRGQRLGRYVFDPAAQSGLPTG